VGAFGYLVSSLDPPGQQAEAEAKSGVTAGGKAPAAGNPSTVSEKPISDVPSVPKPPEKVNLTFVGDILFASKVEDLLKTNGYAYPYKYVKSYLEKADITIANLESPITDRGKAESKEYVFRSPVQALPELKNAGVDVLNLANNHIMDYGQEGLLDTFDHLDTHQFLRIGAGRNIDEAFTPAIVQHQGMKIAFLGFSRVIPSTSWYAGKNKPGVAESYSTKMASEAIRKARAEADLVVVIAHWGQERKDRPVKEQVDLAHTYIDEGADLVVASHPHVLQGFEQYKGKWIAYSLGNFIFTTNEVPATWESMILEASCTKERTCELHMIPIMTKWAQPIRMVEDLGLKLFERLSRVSYNAKIDEQGNIRVGPVNTGFLAPAVEAVPPTVKTPPAKSPSSGVKSTETKPTESKTTDSKSTTPKTEGKSTAPAQSTSTSKPAATPQKEQSKATAPAQQKPASESTGER
jgi:poly-gamma-glutamate capsule biosynthesis protein CapA/YwtB (metallophosphatase superfamily)